MYNKMYFKARLLAKLTIKMTENQILSPSEANAFHFNF